MAFCCAHCTAPTQTRSTLIGAPICSAACSAAYSAARAGQDLAFVGAESEVAAVLRAYPGLVQLATRGKTLDQCTHHQKSGYLIPTRWARPIASMLKRIGAYPVKDEFGPETQAEYDARVARHLRDRAAEVHQPTARQRTDMSSSSDAPSATVATAAPTTLSTATAGAPTPPAREEPTFLSSPDVPLDLKVMFIDYMDELEDVMTLAAATNYHPRVMERARGMLFSASPSDIGSLDGEQLRRLTLAALEMPMSEEEALQNFGSLALNLLDYWNIRARKPGLHFISFDHLRAYLTLVMTRYPAIFDELDAWINSYSKPTMDATLPLMIAAAAAGLSPRPTGPDLWNRFFRALGRYPVESMMPLPEEEYVNATLSWVTPTTVQLLRGLREIARREARKLSDEFVPFDGVLERVSTRFQLTPASRAKLALLRKMYSDILESEMQSALSI